MFRRLCGDETLKNVILVTNMWNEVSPEDGEDREKELSDRFFKPALDKGAQIVRHHGTPESARDIIRKIMANHPVALRVQKELVDEGKGIGDTEAGKAISEEVAKLIRKHQADLNELRAEMAQALEERNEQMRQEIEAERRRVEKLMETIKVAPEEMASKFAAEKWRMAVKLTKVEEAHQAKMHEEVIAHREKMERETKERAEMEAKGGIPIYL